MIIKSPNPESPTDLETRISNFRAFWSADVKNSVECLIVPIYGLYIPIYIIFAISF